MTGAAAAPSGGATLASWPSPVSAGVGEAGAASGEVSDAMDAESCAAPGATLLVVVSAASVVVAACLPAVVFAGRFAAPVLPPLPLWCAGWADTRRARPSPRRATSTTLLEAMALKGG